MSRPVITVENLSKAYRIGLKEEIPDTLVAAMSGLMKAPFRKFRELRKLDTFGHSGGEEEDLYWALKDVSFEVQEGEVLGVIGRNGAGKSTLLKILSRITEPTRGRAVIRGRVSSLLEVGTGFHPELSGRENVYLNGTILGMTKREIDRKFDEIVDFSGVEKFLDTPIKRYSSGMKVRLAFAVAAHLEPEILIIDEVLAVGDAEFQAKCMGKMQDVARAGRTVIFVSHDLHAVQRLCDRGLELQNGQVATFGSCEKALDSYNRHCARVAECPVGERLDREGTGAARILAVRIRNRDRNVTDWIPLGDPLTIEIDYECREACPDALFAIGIMQPNRGPLAQLNTRFCGLKLDLTRPGGTVRCEIPRMVLAPGTYSINLSLANSPHRFNYDQVCDVLQLHVTQGDFFASGVVPSPQVGPLVIEHHWSIGEHASNFEVAEEVR